MPSKSGLTAVAAILLVALCMTPCTAAEDSVQPAGDTGVAVGPALPTGPAAPADASAVMPALPPGVIAMVNGEMIARAEWVETCTRVAGQGILGVMIRYKIVQQEARKLGLTMSDEQVQIEVDRLVAEAGGPSNFRMQLAEMGENEADFRERIRTETLLRKIVEKNVTVLEDEVKKFFLEQYGRKAQVQVVVTQTQPDAQAVVTQARGGRDFSELAMEYSKDEYTATNHAYLPGLLSDGFFPKPYGLVVITESMANMLFGLKAGEVSNVVPAGEAGFYVFRVASLQPAAAVSFETVKESVRVDALAAKVSQASGMYLQQLLQKADIRVGLPQ